jgi:flagellar motor switch protein FliN/FliY
MHQRGDSMNEKHKEPVQGVQEPPPKAADAEEVEFAEMEADAGRDQKSKGLDFLLDIPLEVSVELGRRKIQIGELLKLGQGSVVELEKLTTTPVDIFINQKFMGHGEVVVVNDRFAVRLTQVISPGDRVKSLA